MNTDQIIAWLNNEAMRNQVYHDHKENMMWLSFILFLTGAVAMMLWIDSKVEITYKVWAVMAVSIATLFTIFFISWQFNNREKASSKIAGIIYTTCDLLAKGQQHLNWNITNGQILPAFVTTNMRRKIPTKIILLNLLPSVVFILIVSAALITIVSNK